MTEKTNTAMSIKYDEWIFQTFMASINSTGYFEEHLDPPSKISTSKWD